MKYPYNLIGQDIKPLFGDELIGQGVYVNLSDGSDIFNKCVVKDQVELQKYVNDLLVKQNTNWAISDFGERRERFFRELAADQMVEERRFYHLGLDIWMQFGKQIFVPLAGTIVEVDYEKGFGNYGGYAVLRHDISDERFYSFFGHLKPSSLPQPGTVLNAGDQLARLGDMSENGGYFFHTHLQVLTERGYRNGFVHKGYATDEVFTKINKYVLDPRFLFR